MTEIKRNKGGEYEEINVAKERKYTTKHVYKNAVKDCKNLRMLLWEIVKINVYIVTPEEI